MTIMKQILMHEMMSDNKFKPYKAKQVKKWSGFRVIKLYN